MRIRRRFLVGLGFALGAAAAGWAGVPGYAVVVSVDGLRADLIDRTSTPNIDLMARTGCRALAARTIKPAVTLPAHASMLTGLLPARHGVDFNKYRPDYPGLAEPTFLTAAAAAGKTVAAFVGKRKLLHLLGDLGEARVEHPGYTAAAVMDRALPYLREERPHVTFLHLPDVDTAGHAEGWGSTSQLAAVEAVDLQIGRLFRAVYDAGILRETVFLLTADHGGHGKVHGVHHPREFQIEWIAAGLGIQPGHAIEAPVSVLDTPATVLTLLGLETPAGLDGRVVSEALYTAEPRAEADGTAPVQVGWAPHDITLPPPSAPASGDTEVALAASPPAPGIAPPAREDPPRAVGFEWPTFDASGILPPHGEVAHRR